jgi:23S rRNA pseudouridine1911/1915/1917 synthase
VRQGDVMGDPAETDRCSLRVDEDAEGARVDRFLADRLVDVSRSQIQKLIREHQVLLDGATCKPSTSLKEGEVVSWPADVGLNTVALEPEPIPIQAVFEDDDLLVLHKPPGLVIHPAPGHWRGTLVNALLHRWPNWRAPGGRLRPGIVHRLDKDTSGLLVVARSARAYHGLREQISTRQAQRAYVALVWGRMDEEEGEFDGAIGRDPHHRQRMAVVSAGKPAATQWHVLSRFDTLTLLHLELRTGRTHQVRVHLSNAGHPVFGDPFYGGVEFVSRLSPLDRQRAQGLMRELGRLALHAYRLAFRHPSDGAWLEFEAPVPADMERVLLSLAKSGGKE